MKPYLIKANDSIDLSPKKNFYGSNSLLNVKLTRMPENHRGVNLLFKAIYKNVNGATLTCPIILFPPYYFNAITPDFSDLGNNINQEFVSVELKSTNNFEVELLVSLNTDLHSNLDTFFKIPEVKVLFRGRQYDAEIEELERHPKQMGDEILYKISIFGPNNEEMIVGKVTEYPEGSFTFYDKNAEVSFSENQVIRFLNE